MAAIDYPATIKVLQQHHDAKAREYIGMLVSYERLQVAATTGTINLPGVSLTASSKGQAVATLTALEACIVADCSSADVEPVEVVEMEPEEELKEES